MASEGRELSRKVLAFFSALLFLAMFMPSGFAAPSNGAVTTGSGTITKSGDTTTISQTSNKLGINWQTFSIGSGETVVFVQPGFSSIALNRVIGSEPSAIYGQLTANGKVFLINPQGILFAPTAQVNVGALAASTLNISDSDFTAGTYTFSGAGGSVINQGNIKAADGGYVALLGGQIVNQGTIVVKSGTIALGAGNAVTLDMAGDGLINLAVSQATVNAQITNNNLLKADGGRILMTARTADELAGTVINNSGTIRANSISTVNGVIRLDGGDQGIVVNTGALSAAGLDDYENGGSITLRGGNVQLDSTTNIDASGTTGGTVKVSAVGDLTISNNLSAGTNANIILRADHNGTGAGTVNFQESGSVALSGSGAAEIYYNPVAYTSPADYAGKVTGGTLTAYMLVNNVNQLQAMNTNLAGAYALGKDIDAGASAAWNSGAGFAPIGSSGKFSGKFNGDGHTISNLYIHRPSQGYVGLFGELTGTVKNVGLVNMSVSGNMYTGALVGLNYGSISNSYSSASVTGYQYVGGLVGDNHVHSSISNCYSSGTVSGTNHVGGLIGGNTYGSISNSYSTSTVSGSSDSQYVGGLVGHNGNDDGLPGGSISNSYSAGAVTSGSGSSDVGGLVGANSGSVSSSFWNKTTSGQTVSDGGTGLTTAGMMNQSNFSGWDFGNTWRIYGGYTYPLLKSFLTPLTVTANDFSRTYNGTTGYAGNAGVSYSATPTGSLFGTLAYGGTAQAAKNAGEYTIVPSGLYSGQQGYDIAYANGTLSIIPRPITITANASRVYGNANPASGPVTVTSGSLAGTDALSSAALSSPATAASNVGGYSLTPSGVTFASGSAANYTITYANGTLTVTPRPITVKTNNASRVYGDANPTSGVINVTAGSLAGTDALGSTAGLTTPAAATSSVGNYKLTPDGVSFTSGSAANYAITYADSTLTITPRPIAVTANNASRVYGNANPASGAVSLTSGSLVGTDTLGNAALSSPAGAASSVGDYSLTPSGVTFTRGSAANYTITYANGTLSITPRPITITANASRLYGNANPASGAVTVASGSLAGTDALGNASLNSPATAASNVGGYSLTPSGVAFASGSAANYTITYADGTLSITPRPITVKTNNASRVYGDANPTSGVVNVTAGSLAGTDALGSTAGLSTPAVAASSVGTYKLTPDGVSFTSGSAANYAITYADSTLTITPRPIAVTANNASRVYGDANPANGPVSLTSGSLVGTDTLGNAALSSPAAAASSVGDYSLTPSGVTFTRGSAANYTITYANGTLSITPRPITITANASRVYGNANPASGVVSVINGSLAGADALGNASLNSLATAASNVGSYSLTPSGVTFASGSAANYTITYADGTLSITPRPLTVTANNTSRVYGNANPASGTVSLTSGSLAGTDTLGSVAALSSPATAASNVGSYSLTPSGITFIHGRADNYTITYADGTLSITPRPITVTANASRVYGDANPANGPVNVVSGSLVGTDALGNANLVSPAAVTSSVGAYSLTPSAVTLQRGSAANYSISYANGILTITPRPISVTAVGKNKSYDGTTFASVIYNDNRINGDNLTVTGTAAFSDPNPGDDKPVSVTDIRLSGTAAGNYTLQNTFAFTIADIVTRSSSLNKASSFLQPLVQPFFALPAIQAAIGSQNTDEDDWLPEDL